VATALLGVRPLVAQRAPAGSMDRMAVGAAGIPDAVTLPSRVFRLGGWDVMTHGFAFAQVDVQGGPRGGTQTGSLSWGMLMASHGLAGGTVQGRVMLSLDPAGVTARGYPLLLQTGESYRGVPLVDRQHPHDAFMEIGARYAHAVAPGVSAEVYAAPVGEPALGPVAFMHRPSAMDNPTAPLGHHWQDATHVAFGVLTAGLRTRRWTLEGSAFNGREPDDRRWNLDPIRLDSRAGRLTIRAGPNWSLMAGYGFLASPEALAPAASQHRITASAMYGRPIGTAGQWATTLLWSANAFSGVAGLSHSVLLESEAVLNARNTLFARVERAPRTAADLALAGPPASLAPDRAFAVGALSLGYVRELVATRGATFGLGAIATVNVVPAEVGSAYGSRAPVGGMIFLRARVVGLRQGGPMHDMNGMSGK
jgi:hypothetical protein